MRTDKLAACHTKSTDATDKRCTPKPFFLYVQKLLGVKFTIDIAASKSNTLCENYYSQKDNTLKKWWRGTAWCNPPYSLTEEFVIRAYTNARKGYGSTALLLAARTDQLWWDYALKTNVLAFIRGRIKFVGADAGAPFPSVVLYFGKKIPSPKLPVIWTPSPYERGFSRK